MSRQKNDDPRCTGGRLSNESSGVRRPHCRADDLTTPRPGLDLLMCRHELPTVSAYGTPLPPAELCPLIESTVFDAWHHAFRLPPLRSTQRISILRPSLAWVSHPTLTRLARSCISLALGDTVELLCATGFIGLPDRHPFAWYAARFEEGNLFVVGSWHVRAMWDRFERIDGLTIAKALAAPLPIGIR